ncbi:MAG: NAD(P)-dependent oxidoreductase, partial [Cyanobacteria bacterium]|nr:NAD(P)-dependent oxidoreductase [Cyanobacteriota bacterium]MDA0867766.1 NAD(P)-dependent oxidoreductase [Cyanobacteriota bacterium]
MGVVLVTGASGFLGGSLCQTLSQTWKVHGTHWTHPLVHPRVIGHRLNLTDAPAVLQLWQDCQPDAVIHTAAQANANVCEQQPEVTDALNVIVAGQLAQCCAEANIPFLFMSTDLVFGGDHPPYAETDPADPLSHYGRQKAIAEAQILATYPRATICRLPLLYGLASPTGQGFLQGFLAKLRAGQPSSLFTDEFRTPVTVMDAAMGVQLALERHVEGVWHLGGPERISRYDFGRQIAQAFGLSYATIQPSLRAAVSMPAPRPRDVS